MTRVRRYVDLSLRVQRKANQNECDDAEYLSHYQLFFHVAPLYVCITPVLVSVAVQSVQYKVNPVAGEGIASRCAVVIRGSKAPCVVLVISSAALAAAPSVVTTSFHPVLPEPVFLIQKRPVLDMLVSAKSPGLAVIALSGVAVDLNISDVPPVACNLRM